MPTLLKALFYVVVVVGIAFYAVDLYTSRGGWSYSLAEPPKVSVEPPTTLVVGVKVQVYNPSHSKVMIRNLWYSIYVNGYFVGEGFKPYVTLRPGNNTLILKTSFDLANVPCPLAKTIYEGKDVEVNVTGYAVADLMVFGKLSFRSITVPFNVEAAEVSLPKLPTSARSLLYVYIYYCDHSEDIMRLLSKLSAVSGVLG